MKILLVGEYSRLHNSLKEGLVALGHTVTIVGCGDRFKKFETDLSIAPKIIANNRFFRFLNKFSIRVLKLDLERLEKGIRFKKILPTLKNYDVVQLINSDAIGTFPKWEIKLYQKLFLQNKKKFLLICGEETPIIEIYLKNNLKYSILTPYLENKKLKKYFSFSLKYISKPYRKLFDFIEKNCDGFIVSDLDYKIPMSQTSIACTLIPNPINLDLLPYQEMKITDKIVIFHGINPLSSIKKGNHFFEKALTIIKEKYQDKIEIITAVSVPYKEYIELYNKAHILLDMVYSYDQGYNALEAMAKGKVVFTGAETEFETYYNIKERVNINAKPNVESLVHELSYLIENPNEILAISKRARKFIEQEHYYVKIAEKYVSKWNIKT